MFVRLYECGHDCAHIKESLGKSHNHTQSGISSNFLLEKMILA